MRYGLADQSHARNGFPLDRARVQRIIQAVLSSLRTFVQTKWRKHETVRVSRRRRCWTLLTQMDPGNTPQRRTRIRHVTGSKQLDTRRARFGTSFNQQRNATLTELPKLSSSNIHVPTSVRVKDERRAEAKVNTAAAENRERVPVTRTSLPSKTTIIPMMRTWMNPQMPTKLNGPVDPRSDDGKGAPNCDDGEENDTFSLCVAVDDQLNWMQLLFLPTRGTMFSIPK